MSGEAMPSEGRLDRDETRPPGRRVERIVVAIVVVGVVGLLFARAPYAAQKFWAEDGREFYEDALVMGPFETFGQSNAGYFLVVPRIGGVLASWVPVRAAAFMSWLWVATVVAWCAATVMVTGRAWLTTLSARAGLALGLVLLPVLGEESIANAANLQFTMLFAALIVLIGRPRGRLEWISGCALVAATGLTTPLATVLVPFVVYRVWRSRPRWFDPIAVAWLGGVAVQWLAIALARPERNPATGEPVKKILQRYLDAAVTQNLSPLDRQTRGVGVLLVVVLVAAIGVAAVVAWRQRDRERAVLLIAVPAFGFALLAASGLQYSAANRYMVLPSLCLVWAILAASESLWTLLPASWPITQATAVGVVVAGLLVAWLPHWNASEIRQSGPTWAEGLDEAARLCRDDARNRVEVLIAPVLEPGAKQWSVTLTCDQVS